MRGSQPPVRAAVGGVQWGLAEPVVLTPHHSIPVLPSHLSLALPALCPHPEGKEGGARLGALAAVRLSQQCAWEAPGSTRHGSAQCSPLSSAAPVE